ncbi:MAG: phospholipase D family protein [Deltaproteobacteria bacterium]|jgi:hypothetical protein|nr:phospholipase D family protein [Deltaproteobacteria bacterium]
MLNPGDRTTITSLFEARKGQSFTDALATTYSLDPYFLLHVPVSLATGGGITPGTNILEVFEATRKYSGRISVFVQAGQIRVPATASGQVYALAEKMIVSVPGPEGGIFHPKIWVVRFGADDGSPSAFYRLAVLTKNLTMDRCWDLSLTLEGWVTKRARQFAGQRDLASLIGALPGMANLKANDHHRARAETIAGEIGRVDWELPDGVDDFKVFVHGLRKWLPTGRTANGRWKLPENASKLLVMSPFCSDDALERLADGPKEKPILISRPETLADLNGGTLARFESIMTLDGRLAEDVFEEEDPPEPSPDTDPTESFGAPVSGLHAKLYLAEIQRRGAVLAVGSANATNHGLGLVRDGGNVEIVAQLTGKKSALGDIGEILGKKGLGDWLEAYAPEAAIEPTAEEEAAKETLKRLDGFKRLMTEANVSIACERTASQGLFSLSLKFPPSLIESMEGDIAGLRVWPITVPEENAVDILGGENEGVFGMGDFTAFALTNLVAFRLIPKETELSLSFVLGLQAKGFPKKREHEILKYLIKDENSFHEYLFLLLKPDPMNLVEDLGGFGSETDDDVSRGWSKASGLVKTHLLENLTKTYCRNPLKFAEVSDIMYYLFDKENMGILPEGFGDFWKVFETAVRDRRD